MNEASQWRMELASTIAEVYREHPPVSAIIQAGGVARGRGDSYSDIDIAVFWKKSPTPNMRHDLISKIPDAINASITYQESRTINLFNLKYGMLWEDVLYIGNKRNSRFKIDINHRTVNAMERIIRDVVIDNDTHGHKLEVCYAIQHARILYGHDLVGNWQNTVASYPQPLADKLISHHLAQLNNDVEMHIHRDDLYYVYRTFTDAIYHIMATLLALNHIYRPELKRLPLLCDELAIKPDHLAHRLNGLLTTNPEEAANSIDHLVDEVFALVNIHMPHIETHMQWEAYHTRRQPFNTSPLHRADEIQE